MTRKRSKPKKLTIAPGCFPASVLDAFCRRYNIAPARLSHLSRVSYSNVQRLVAGRGDVMLGTAKMLAKGASLIVRRKVLIGELFDLDYFVDLNERAR